MAEDIDPGDQTFENPTNYGAEKISDINALIDEYDNVSPKQETINMEIHASHLHHAPGKKIWHYFFEFLMLFLAVFCGFIAENWREQLQEHQREREFIHSIV